MPGLQSSSNPFGSSVSASQGNPNYVQSPPPAVRPSMAQFAPQQSQGGGGGMMPWQAMAQQQQQWQPPNFQIPDFNYTPPNFTMPEIPQSPMGGGTDWLQAFTPPELSVSSGMAMPQMPGQPSAPAMPGVGGSPQMQAGARTNYASALAPLLAALMGNYHQGAAPLNSGFQQAQAASGLGWAGLGSDMVNQQRDYQTRQQSGLLSLLRDIFARSYA